MKVIYILFTGEDEQFDSVYRDLAKAQASIHGYEWRTFGMGPNQWWENNLNDEEARTIRIGILR